MHSPPPIRTSPSPSPSIPISSLLEIRPPGRSPTDARAGCTSYARHALATVTSCAHSQAPGVREGVEGGAGLGHPRVFNEPEKNLTHVRASSRIFPCPKTAEHIQRFSLQGTVSQGAVLGIVSSSSDDGGDKQ
ncbi:hypothetical protein BaRGS_00030660 [Batillaria attramentaria]|uniref:Uncharacterized protein n=1 Tax=Batillaria attramentaria TaxID=370345 RepID=A0ABD0JU20_9CAEN